MIEIIKEYLVSLGWEVDKKSFAEAKKGLNALDKSVEAFRKGLMNNKGFQLFTKSFNEMLGKVNAGIEKFAASTAGTAAGIATTVGGLVVTITGAITAITAAFMNSMAKADLQVQILARRLFTSVENARSLKATMDAMGLKDFEDLKDVAYNPELRGQFFALRELSAGLALEDSTKEGFKNVRALGFEFQKLSLIMNYFWQSLGGQLGKALEGPLKDLQNVMMSFNRFVLDTMPAATKDLANLAGFFYKILEIGIKLQTLALKLPVVGEVLKGILSYLSGVLEKWNKALDDANGLLDSLGGSEDRYKTKDDAFKELSLSLKKIMEFLKPIGDFFASILRPVRDFITKWLANFIKDHPKISKAVQITAGALTGAPVQAATAGTSAGRLFWGNKDKSSSAIDTFIRALSHRVKENFNITAGVATKGHVSHGKGLAFDIGLAGKSDASILALTKAALSTDGLKMANLELSPARYSRILQMLRADGINDPRVTNYKSKYSHGDHLHVGLKPIQNITINIHGGEPRKTAQAVVDVLNEQTQRTLRVTQGAYA